MFFYDSQRTFVEFKDSVITDFKDSIWRFGKRDADINFSTWSNSSLQPKNRNISDHSYVIDWLKYAREEDTLHRIHNYVRSLAFTVTVKLYSDTYCKFRCYDLSTIILQAAAKDLIEAASENLFQTSEHHALAIPGSGSLNLIPNTDPKVLAKLRLMLSNLGEVWYNTPISDDGRFTYEVHRFLSEDWSPNGWQSQMEKMWAIFSRSAGHQPSGPQRVLQLPPGEL